MNGLVLEGGARRCIFTAGAVDCFMDNHIKFDYIAGVSAGAQIALNLISNQRGRSKDVILPHNDGGHGIIQALYSSDLNKMTYEYPYDQFPFDFDAFFSSDIECEIVATSCKTGKAEYFSEKSDEKMLLDMLCASCTLPILYQSVDIGDDSYIDGSIADAIPFERALSKGCDKVLVILAKPENESATNYSKFKFAINKIYGAQYPNLVDSLLNRLDVYNAECERLYQAEKDGKVMIIRPDKTYVKSFERNTDSLESTYEIGYSSAKAQLENIKEFLGLS